MRRTRRGAARSGAGAPPRAVQKRRAAADTGRMPHRLRLPHRLLAAAALATLTSALLALPARAGAEPYLPPAGTVFAGVASGDDVADFEQRTGTHPAVWQQWIQWGKPFAYAFDRARGARARLMLHVSTAAGQNRSGSISPGAIARGDGDAYLLSLNAAMAAQGAPVYVRLMGEMNNCDLAYSAYNCNGSRRSPDFSSARFVQAWRRMVLVLRGGDVAALNARLAALRLPPVRGAAGTLPAPQVAFVWSPMTGGSPMISALAPERYWPGGAYVDWIGTSFYSKFPNFRFLEPYYAHFAARYRKPFVFAEWGMWGADRPGFVRDLFAWVGRHPGVRMMVYNQGAPSPGLFRLGRYPRAAAVVRSSLASPRFAQVAPEFAG
jgi:hypothetical protein